MTKLVIDLSDVAGGTHPDDSVVVWSPVHREGSAGRTVSPTQHTIRLTEGKGEREVEPGPLMVQTHVRAIADTRPKEVTVPDQDTVTLWDLLEQGFTYTPQIISEVSEARAEVREAVARVGTAEQVGQWAEDAATSETNASTAASDALTIKNSIPQTVATEVDTQVPPKVAEVIGGDTVVRDAAAAAATDAVDEVIGGVLDSKADRAAMESADTALGRRIDGKASISYVQAVSFGAAAAMSGGSDNSSAGGGGEDRDAWTAEKPIYLWGDSAIDRGIPGDRLADYLDATIHQEVVDNSNGGTPINDLLFRTGAVPIYGTPAGGSIPGDSTPVEVDVHGPLIGFTHGAEVPVTWAGIPGTLKYHSGSFHESGVQVVEFIRSSLGGNVNITAPTRLAPTDTFDPHATHIIVTGGNDASKGYIQTAPEDDKAGHLIAGYIRLVEQAAASPVKHMLIGGVKTRSTTMPGDTNHRLVVTVNNQLKQLFPHLFVDRQRWLCERGPDILGLTLTPDEQVQRDAGIIPARVFTDETHVGSEIRQAEAKELWGWHLVSRGWAQAQENFIGHRMPIMEYTPTTSDLADAMNQLPLSGARSAPSAELGITAALAAHVTELEARIAALEP